MLVQFFIPHPAFKSVYTGIVGWARVVGVFAVVIGVGALVRLHFRRITRRTSGWGYSIVVFAGMLTAAAATYVAATIAAVAQLLYWAWRLGLLGGRSD